MSEFNFKPVCNPYVYYTYEQNKPNFTKFDQFRTIDCTFARYLTINQKKVYEKTIVIDAYSGYVNDRELQ
jgi:hypothetical protein